MYLMKVFVMISKKFKKRLNNVILIFDRGEMNQIS